VSPPLIQALVITLSYISLMRVMHFVETVLLQGPSHDIPSYFIIRLL
jgi:hypothetical protein